VIGRERREGGRVHIDVSGGGVVRMKRARVVIEGGCLYV
jgi:hypothetical protein